MCAQNKRLTILSEEERFALYELPDFDEVQQHEYFDFTEEEKQIMHSRPTLSAQIYCGLQIGYFKAKQFFFDFDWSDIPQEDISFLLQHYWPEPSSLQPITKYEYYTQVKEIIRLYDYRPWSKEYTELLLDHISRTAKRDINIGFILPELLQFLRDRRIVRPGYTTLQDIISKAINAERERLANIVSNALNAESQKVLEQLLSRDDVLYYLSALKQDSKDFSYKVMVLE